MRTFKIVRVLRFINSLLKDSIMITLIGSFLQIKHILLLNIIVFICAVLGISLFSPVMYRGFYNDQNNFRNIFKYLVLLLRCITDEDWNGIMHDLASDNLCEGQDALITKHMMACNEMASEAVEPGTHTHTLFLSSSSTLSSY